MRTSPPGYRLKAAHGGRAALATIIQNGPVAHSAAEPLMVMIWV